MMAKFMWRASGLTLLWWVISGGEAESWWIGLPAVLLAAYLSTKFDNDDQQPIHVVALLGFIPYFLIESIRGGLDVARRAYSREMPLAPAILNYPLRLPAGRAQVFFANSVSLLPGTLAAGVTDHMMRIHLLDHTTVTLAELNRLELKVAAVFGIEIDINPYPPKEKIHETF